ncbi:MAG: helix-turn-helix transcriptional regulator [Rhodobacteraceae bacterium]|nr:helix-turn-helix transcriptional regulator [Paracoccaceae bacterium]MCY4138360.1 helix-turn-helix transcriptional regulator [Paracoccaceae bacterium]
MRRPKKRITPKRISHHLQASIARNVRHHRLRRRMTLAELAYESDLSSETIRAIEAGQGDPRASTLEALAAVMRVDMRELINREWMHDQANAEEKIRYLGTA